MQQGGQKAKVTRTRARQDECGRLGLVILARLSPEGNRWLEHSFFLSSSPS